MSSIWKFRPKRLKDTARVLFKSRMAAAGTFILILFIFLAVAAPLLTSSDPEYDRVSGALAHPSWYTYFGEGSRLSQNFNLEAHTGFRSDPFQNQWVFSSSPSLRAQYSPGISAEGSGGSVQISLDGASPSGSYSANLY